jgi:hypothetical protein
MIATSTIIAEYLVRLRHASRRRLTCMSSLLAKINRDIA